MPDAESRFADCMRLQNCHRVTPLPTRSQGLQRCTSTHEVIRNDAVCLQGHEGDRLMSSRLSESDGQRQTVADGNDA